LLPKISWEASSKVDKIESDRKEKYDKIWSDNAMQYDTKVFIAIYRRFFIFTQYYTIVPFGVIICQNMPKHANKSTPTKALNLAIILQIITNYCKKTHHLCDYIRKCKKI